MLLSAVSVLVVSQSSSEIPEGLMNNPVYTYKRFSQIYILDNKLVVLLAISRTWLVSGSTTGVSTVYENKLISGISPMKNAGKHWVKSSMNLQEILSFVCRFQMSEISTGYSNHVTYT